ncbi:hypothetical protein T552_01492 [Pneumocystis carinii B80]|uniref:Translation machinery associated TMA7 n=1 Tax=Pneumocystis carinii (strain B80) TaxID=1408658 RepID=A0A0W4ZKG4_PNEC8|nr:hypothetical protein T552_01492 [Pneumocystis carinii B80]KTW28863.1 hypothetical protein T552_01492 [Pneumocystis carinii B80]
MKYLLPILRQRQLIIIYIKKLNRIFVIKMPGKEGGKLKPLKMPKKPKQELDEDDLNFKKKQNENLKKEQEARKLLLSKKK